jgi:hypothetical protein
MSLQNIDLVLQDESFVELYIDAEYVKDILRIYYPDCILDFNTESIQILDALIQVKSYLSNGA